MKAIRIHSYGDSSVLAIENVSIPAIKNDEILIHVKAAGVNFVDTYQRSGLYPLPSLPATLGKEGAGTIAAIGKDVTDFYINQRVCFAQLQGVYANYVVAKSSALLPLPEDIDYETAAASMLQGLTAVAFTNVTHNIKAGERVFITAGAGGLGSLLIQICKQKGAFVATVTSTPEKVLIAKENGADLIFTAETIEELKKIEKFDVVYDSVGRDTFRQSLSILKPLGHLVLCGNASGAVPPLDPLDLMKAGSITLTRPSLMHYIADKKSFTKMGEELFSILNSLKVRIKSFPLEAAKDAQELLTNRGSIGKLILIPN